MKLKLLFAAFTFAATVANAQLASINENFNSFTEGNATFPQSGWSAIVAPNPLPYPPAPLMIVTTGTDKAVQSYAGNNGTTASHLITPQIVAPTGDKTLSFTAGLVASSPGTSTIQIGMASNPADMTTFTPVGTAFSISSTTAQTYTVSIPASASTYIVFKITPSANHTATLIDNVVYDTPPLATINESFNSFTAGSSAIPQNGWSKVIATAPHNVYIAANNGSNAIQFYSANTAGTTSYLVSPKIVAPNGSKKVRYTIGVSAASNGNATLEVGLVSNPTDMTTFTSLGSATTIALGSAAQTLTFDVPASASQYIAWKFVGAANHSAVYVDDVIYDVLSVLSTSDVTKSKDLIKFAVNTENTALQFVGKVQPKNLEIYSAAGQKVVSGKIDNSQFDISALQTGVYYILIETTEGKAVKSKFIKK